MDVRNVYEKIGGDFDDVMSRLRKEERVEKFLKLFLKDTSFAELKESMEKNDIPAAFKAAHTAKGVCANLSLERLRAKASALTEDLRDGKNIPHAMEYYPEVMACYEETVKTIQESVEE